MAKYCANWSSQNMWKDLTWWLKLASFIWLETRDVSANAKQNTTSSALWREQTSRGKYFLSSENVVEKPSHM